MAFTHPLSFCGFIGDRLITRGALAEVFDALRAAHHAEPDARAALYSEATGRAVDLDLRVEAPALEIQLEGHPLLRAEPDPPEPLPKRRGRPRLGVVSKEISLLPRHWAWLGAQRGGASAALRRLVEEASRRTVAQREAEARRDAAHAFMWERAGDLAGFEEASRSFYRGDFVAFYDRAAAWPEGVRAQASRLVEIYRAAQAIADAEAAHP